MVEKVKDNTGKLIAYRYRERANGFVRKFPPTKEGREEAEEMKVNRRRKHNGLPPSDKAMKRYTAGDIVNNYMAGKPNNVRAVLWRFVRRMGDKPLLAFDAELAEKYISDRLKEKLRIRKGNPFSFVYEDTDKCVTPRTVHWEMMKLRRAWIIARKLDGLSELKNPWEVTIVGSSKGRRTRSLEEGELDKLIQACKGCLGINKEYIALGILLAVETGLRRQELIDLCWEDIDFKKRWITIQKSKTTDEPQDIVLTLMAGFIMQTLSLRLTGELTGKGKIFTMTKEAFTRTFGDVVKRAGLTNLKFHDLRRTANMMFIRAGLSEIELNVMMRHEDKRINTRYQTPNHFLPGIQDKLDKLTLGGKTLKELEKTMLASLPSRQTRLVEEGGLVSIA